MQSITFVIPHFQDLASLGRLLASIERERVGLPDSTARAIVVDDATPGGRAQLEKFGNSYSWLY